MKIQAYIINLQHATKRWEHMRKNLESLGIPYTRIEAVYGDQLAEPVEGYNEHKYNVLTGKVTNKREIGCYFSHMKAMEEFLKGDQPYALILEDDVTLPKEIEQLLASAIQHEKNWDMIRLTSSRNSTFLPFARLSENHELAYNLRVLKNTGAYFVNRHAARCCTTKMLPMCLPYDVALDRDWDYGFKTACIAPLPVKLEAEFPGQIPKAKRIYFYRATTFHLFHLLTRFERRFHRYRYLRDARTCAGAK
jgi:glycosyl transferase family 25